MRVWGRATRTLFCGYCCAEIKLGDPVEAIVLRGLTRKLWRCVLHASEPPPDDLPPLIKTKPVVIDPLDTALQVPSPVIESTTEFVALRDVVPDTLRILHEEWGNVNDDDAA